MGPRVLKTFFAALTFAMALAGCGVDIGDGSQRAGQQCFQQSDCVDGLRCFERTCVPVVAGPGSDLDAGPDEPDQSQPDGDTPPPDTDQPDVPPPLDMANSCTLGERTCASDTTYQVCIDVGGGRTEFRTVRCEAGTRCARGQCLREGMCQDADGDGFGQGCALGPDCNDDNPRVFPGRPEACQTPFDDNCDGQINEGCPGEECCPNGCGPDEFCDASCTCRVFNPQICEYQNQPCFQEGAFDNGFACFSFDGVSDARCWGICDVNAADPDTTCPETGSVCAFDAGDGQNGICLTECVQNPMTGGDNCGGDMGCLSYDIGNGDGICTPTNPANGPNEACDPNSFFDCVDGFVCVDAQGNGQGRCREACRPFHWDGAGTDCGIGHCAAFSAELGICFRDTNATEGQACQQPGLTCGDDAVGCYPSGGFTDQCTRLCRLAEGNIDCVNGGSCSQFDPNETVLGFCSQAP